ncbi:hypothetical protein CEJ63_24985, partial [Acinetobacter baumannii]
MRATLGQQAAVGQAQATGGTGYQAHLAFERDTGIGFHPASIGERHRPRPILFAHPRDTPTVSRGDGAARSAAEATGTGHADHRRHGHQQHARTDGLVQQ